MVVMTCTFSFGSEASVTDLYTVHSFFVDVMSLKPLS